MLRCRYPSPTTPNRFHGLSWGPQSFNFTGGILGLTNRSTRFAKPHVLDAIIKTVRGELIHNMDGGAFECAIHSNTDDVNEWAEVTIETRRRFKFTVPVGPSRPE
jgi:hypothetical protein